MDEVLFEFVQIGQLLRVAAIDALTGTEVVIMAPLQATRPQMQAVALAKLRARLDAAHKAARDEPTAAQGDRAHVMDRKV